MSRETIEYIERQLKVVGAMTDAAEKRAAFNAVMDRVNATPALRRELWLSMKPGESDAEIEAAEREAIRAEGCGEEL